MVAHTFNPSTWEAEVGGSLWAQGKPGLESEFQDIQGYTEKPCLNTPPKFATPAQNEIKTSN